MRIMTFNDPTHAGKEYEFSYDKFRRLYDNWKPEKHGEKTFQEFLAEPPLGISKDCLYNYLHCRNAMSQQALIELCKKLGEDVTLLLDEMIIKGEEQAMPDKNPYWEAPDTQHLSEFSKAHLYEIVTALDEALFAFWCTLDGEDEYFHALEVLRHNAITIPDSLLGEIESFISTTLDPLFSASEKIMEQLPPIAHTLEGTRLRNQALQQIENDFLSTKYNPFRQHIKAILIS